MNLGAAADACSFYLIFCQVPLLAVAIKAVKLQTNTTVLRLRDADGNEMNGIVWNARVQDELAEKLVPGMAYARSVFP